MSKIIGNASDFYRLRVVRLDETDEPDLEWREDILYREPPRQTLGETESWGLQAVSVDDEESVTRIARYESSEAVHQALAAVTEDLDELTKSEFEKRYLSTGDEL